MAREKFHTLTEQMFYILLCLKTECCGMDIMERVKVMTNGRVAVGPGTLYNLLEQFCEADMIRETKAEGRRRSYILTQLGTDALNREVERLQKQIEDHRKLFG
jgi:DNA-binding PadR family transcriptional regulator